MNIIEHPHKMCPKILIVGAGAAGIAAATRLIEHGLTDITILEAENRIGGRINSVEFGESVVDLGAQWCHGEKDNVVYELVKDLNLLAPSFNDYTDNTYYLPNDIIINKDKTDLLYNIAMNIIGDKERAEVHSGSFGDYFIPNFRRKVIEELDDDLEGKQLSEIMIDWFHKFFLCLDSSKNWFEASSIGSSRYKSCEGNHQLQWKHRGYKTILDVLMKKDTSSSLSLDDKIFLNKQVSKIVWDQNTFTNSDGLIVECMDGSSYNVDHVIVTISLGVLKISHKHLFMPSLPLAKVNAIESIGFGAVKKILLKFPERWWGNDIKGFSLLWTENDKTQLLDDFPEGPSVGRKFWLEDVFGFYVIDSHPNVLLAWVVGELVEQVELLSDQQIIDGCMYLLKKFVGNKYNICNPDAVLRSKWKNNPFFNGTYTFYSVESDKMNANVEDIAVPLVSSKCKEVVLFAGESTHTNYFSTVHGAIESGFREAERLLNIYK